MREPCKTEDHRLVGIFWNMALGYNLLSPPPWILAHVRKLKLVASKSISLIEKSSVKLFDFKESGGTTTTVKTYLPPDHSYYAKEGI